MILYQYQPACQHKFDKLANYKNIPLLDQFDLNRIQIQDILEFVINFVNIEHIKAYND